MRGASLPIRARAIVLAQGVGATEVASSSWPDEAAEVLQLF